MSDAQNTSEASLGALRDLIYQIIDGPSENRLWDAHDVAAYLKCGVKNCQNKYLPDPTFPPAIRIQGKGYPKWEPKEVKSWARRFKEKRKK